MKKSKKINSNIGFHKFLLISTSLAFLFVIILSIGYSSFSVSLEIGADALVRADAGVRFTKNSIASLNDGGVEKASSKYSVDTLSHHIELTNCNSSAIYSVSVKNNNNYAIVLKSLKKEIWNNDSIDYEVMGYDLGTEIIDANSEKTFEVKFKRISCNSENAILDSVLKLVIIEPVSINYADNIIAYSNINNPKMAFKGDTITATFSNMDDLKIGVKINGKELATGCSYTNNSGEKSVFKVENGVATLTNVNDNVTFLYLDYVLVNFGGEGEYYKATKYSSYIEKIEFVDYINLNNADEYWDITDDKNGLAYAWVEDKSLYIGSEFKLKSFDLSNAFNNMNTARSIDFNGRLDTSLTTNMKNMFKSCRKFESLDVSSFDTSNVTIMANMFDSVSTIKELDLSNFDTSNVTDMASMFISLSNVLSLNVESFDTSNVTDMRGMFYGETKLSSINLTNFNTEKVTNMRTMFYGDSGLLSLDLSSFDTKNVTQMTNMFYNCKRLTSLDLSNFDTSKVTAFDGMFNTCSGLTSLNITSFNTKSAASFSNMFRLCTSLTSLDLSSFSTSTAKIMDGMFYNDSKLSTIYVSNNWSTKGVLDGKGINLFYGCISLSGNIPFDENKVSVEYASTDYYLTLKESV